MTIAICEGGCMSRGSGGYERGHEDERKPDTMTIRSVDWDLSVEVGEGRCSASWCERQKECSLHTECKDKNLRGFVPTLSAAVVPTREKLIVQVCCCSHSKMSSEAPGED